MGVRISLLLPTRGRPETAERFMDSVAAHTANLDEVEIVIYVDEDDPASHGLDIEGLSIKRIIGPRTNMGQCLTRCLQESKGEVIVAMNDDVIFQTPGWDRQVLKLHQRFEDRVYLGYGNDLWKGKKLCTFPIISRAACEIMVHPFPPAYKGSLIDLHIMDIFQRLKQAGHKRIYYLENIVFEHRHHLAGKAELDDTYRERSRFGDDQNFLCFKDQRRRACQQLLDTITGAQSPEVAAGPEPELPSSGLPSWLAFFIRYFLADRGLPWGWRNHLFIKFCGRRLAQQGYLPGPDKIRLFIHRLSSKLTP